MDDNDEPDILEELGKELEQARERLRSEATERIRAAKALAPLLRPAVLAKPKKLPAKIKSAERVLDPELRERLGIAGVWSRLCEHEQQAPARLRRSLGQALRRACDAEAVELQVVSKEDPVELRIPPLSVQLDFKAGKATLAFARDPLASCELSAERILSTRCALLRDLDRGADPKAIFECLRRAYRCALVELGVADGERVEIVRVLPWIAIFRQSPAFLRNPSRKGFRSYGRGHLAYEVLRLRRGGALSQDGLRMNLGVASGITASQKGRAIYFEDEHGNGEYKLTLYFTRDATRDAMLDATRDATRDATLASPAEEEA